MTATLTLRKSGVWLLQWDHLGKGVTQAFPPDTPVNEVQVYVMRFGLRTILVEVEA